MLSISKITVEHLGLGVVTDQPRPRFSFALESDREGTVPEHAVWSLGDWSAEAPSQIGFPYGGEALRPFTSYEARLSVTDNHGERAEGRVCFETGRLDTAWEADWITHTAYSFKEKRVSPLPMVFRKRLSLAGKVRRARIYATALGIYELTLDGKKVGDRYFAPGFTSYKSQLQYQTYDVTDMLGEGKERVLECTVAGGWAVGSFVFTRKNRITAPRQALLLELRLEYEDGTRQVIGTDESWEVTLEGNVREADFYDGEVYDARIRTQDLSWSRAGVEKVRVQPRILADYGIPVKAGERLRPISRRKQDNTWIYDFGQNFAGVVALGIRGRAGQEITVKHAEILNEDGSLNTAFLRTAKARVHYICREGYQEYSPRFTYMGFRYISIEGIEDQDIEVSALALYSELERTGDFRCSNEMLNRLQSNIVWGAKSNLVDIPTDCPQRDERMGWTGDIALFAPTACWNFDMSRFLEKWLRDVASEQLPTGGIPNTVPAQGYGFPATMPRMAVDFWGDACILVPWAEYMAGGDEEILRTMYPVMKKYVNACRFWAGLFSVGEKRYIWDTPPILHFGDWVAPDVPRMSQWQARAKWTATASLFHTSSLLSKIAGILGNREDEETYRSLSEKVAQAYVKVLTDGKGRMKKEFQTAYVLPIHFGILQGKSRRAAARHLERLVRERDYCIGTGFPGTPYILFALADQGLEETAFRMLMNTKCPSWLYEVSVGATTIWERWDGLDENGRCPIGDDGTDMMISYNHYASGAVGDFLYKRIAGVEPLEAGYRRFRIRPLVGGGITEVESHVTSPYGRIEVFWRLEKERFEIRFRVPVGAVCRLVLPDGREEDFGSGEYTKNCSLSKIMDGTWEDEKC